MPDIHGLDGNRIVRGNRPAALENRSEDLILTQPRDYWIVLIGDRDVGLIPVLSLEESAAHPQTLVRGMITEHNGLKQVGVAPKPQVTPGGIDRLPSTPGIHSSEIPAEIDLDQKTIATPGDQGITLKGNKT